MSRALTLKVCLLSVLGLLCGAGLTASFQPKAPARGLASIGPKTPPLGGDRLLGKHLAVVQVALQAPAGIAERENETTELVGYLRLNRPISSDLHYHWDLPAGVHAVGGAVDDVISDPVVGETVEIRLTVTGFSKDDLKLITLQGSITDGETLLGNSAVLTSRPEDSFEMVAVAAGVQGMKPAAKPKLEGKILR